MDIYSVGQLTTYLREWLESDPFLSDIWLTGELSNVSRSTAGHTYFTLKDAQGQLRAVRFRNTIAGDTPVEDGMAVVAHGRVSFYEVRGDLQFVSDVILPQGAGELDMEFRRLKAKLETEGLFAGSRKRAVPKFPRRIAVVTSPAGAVLHDITTVIGRRYPLTELLVVPVVVQGDLAAQAIERAFKRLNQRTDVDVVIIARGGGSLEELWAFNDERTVRAVYGSRAPVISGVGHETDTTLCDFVADLRAATPSAAAELAVPNREDLKARIRFLERHAQNVMGSLVANQRNEVLYLLRRIGHARIDIDRERQRLDDTCRTALLLVRSATATARSRYSQRLAALGSLDPTRTLERGYAIVQNRSTGGEVVRRTLQAKGGDRLTIQVSDGLFPAVAEGVGLARARRRKMVAQEQLLLLPPARP
ncbi:MAG: exodeoxyribonuclease VII large subunit [Dehalococcoidia bacterium]|nr:exodeoxyribonuclease VII large subunit [Dehalococcoidia bacterium]